MSEITGETVTLIIIALATLGIIILNKLRQSKAVKLKLSEVLDDAEDAIEKATGIDIELNEVVEEVLEEVSDSAESVLEDLKEDGDLDVDLDEVVDDVVEAVKETVEPVADNVIADIVEDLNDNLEATLGGMTVSALKDILRERNLPVSGKKAELIQRLIDA